MTAKRHPKSLVYDYHLLSYDEVDSTNDEARRLAEGGACHGAVIWAKRQTQGKGRQNREWISQDGNLFVSLLLSPGVEIARAPELSFVAAIAACEAIAPLLPRGVTLSCKWPNDLMLNDRKLGGILCESFEASGKRWVVVGIGINVEEFPRKNTSFPATSLHEAGVEIVSAKIVLSRFIHHFIESYNEWKYKGFSPIRAKWVRLAWKLGKPISVREGKKTVQGICKGIDRSGALILLNKSGKQHTISAGEILSPEKKKK